MNRAPRGSAVVIELTPVRLGYAFVDAKVSPTWKEMAFREMSRDQYLRCWGEPEYAGPPGPLAGLLAEPITVAAARLNRSAGNFKLLQC